ncbi:fimbria/pilus periplasmic chaperone [Paraburkholderia solisilvae]|uniref:Putative fimbrial chaperone YadV n=1 Tax=Paraburkholderia solisilvae TaxID=624376 RepID=A0A6J5DJA7_9BURK|nr:fimbria/pilus periplasmic chaperone [Paraburkholderia solisilvae]CAB3753557.1 putative fimbrial chaperone YadV [Paraburkholderia solisilvae]
MFIKQAFKAAIGLSLGLLLMAGSSGARAGVVISATRVIYDEKEPEVTVKLTNEGSVPALVQTWIDHGETRQAPSEIDVPFVVTPPISRIDPAKGQTLRIAYTGEPLPQDKESVFWLNVLEVPPRPSADEAGANKLQLAFHSRIKLFFRPPDLKGASREAPAAVTWRFVDAGGKTAVEAYNPSAYHVSFIQVDVTVNNRSATCEDGGMVGPGERRLFPVSGWKSASGAAQVHYTSLNDLGGSEGGVAPLQAASPGVSP